MMTFLSWVFCLVSLTLILFAITSTNDLFEYKPHVSHADTQIESPVQNTCQSGDLLPDFPKCPFARP
jgi:hypothetical protein